MPKIRVRARAVDMLGRQQIAGIPTAIHELFKNAHDAYAERVEVDYFRRTKVMVLRDDGYGMTRKDVEDRWLTLGTESRLGANRPDAVIGWTGPKKLPRRTIMGEKGIGRLAIAVIAPICILLTRAIRKEGLHDLVIALVHWGLFEQPGLDISTIDVPVIELPGGTLPTRPVIQKLVQQVRNNINMLRSELDKDVFKQLNIELDRAETIAPDRLDTTLRTFIKKNEEPLSVAGEGYGTHFILLPTAPELDDDIDRRSEIDGSKLEKFLLGFSNTMTNIPPVMVTEFRDHHLDEYPTELIGPKNFFSPEDLDNADHRFKGEFDEFGQFNGEVSIYGQSRPYVCNWTEGRGRATKCGPFSINFAYVHGNQWESHLPSNSWKEITDKLNRIGGLYIYRDNIRILPYGNSDVDYLDIELRRNKSFKDWFFSYRRVLGFVAISHEQNEALSEKAGREGFRENLAYRNFRSILINLFQRIAMEFFRETAPQGDTFREQKEALKAEKDLLEKQKKKADDRRADFRKLLEKFFRNFEEGDFENKAEEIRQNATNRLERLLTLEDDGDLAIGVREFEADLWERISDLEAGISISKPRGLALTKKLEKDWAAYQRMSADMRSSIVEPLRKEIDELLRNSTRNRINDLQRREAALQLMESQRDSLVKDLSALRRDTYNSSEEMRQTLKSVVREEFARFRDAVENLLVNFTRKTAQDPGTIEEARIGFEHEISVIRERQSSLLESISRQMKDLGEGLKDRETSEDRIGALEQRTQRLEEQLDFYSDFAQMGMAVGILQHEFEKSASNMRTAMRDLKPWADGTPEMKKVYRRLRNSFDYLEGYLKVLDPLGRRLNRTKVELSGDEIRMHLLRIFRAALDEDGIQLEVSDEFLSRKVRCISSSLLGAFINVVDNAIYWVSNGARKEKIIRLDADNEGFLISNTGPGIEERLRERIFEFGETTKPGGRGMGLAISRDTLQKENFDIELIQAGSDVQPVFKIKTSNEDKGDTHEL